MRMGVKIPQIMKHVYLSMYNNETYQPLGQETYGAEAAGFRMLSHGYFADQWSHWQATYVGISQL